MILNFLQTRDPPILPSLHKLPERLIDKGTGKSSLSSFADDVEKLQGFGKGNTETLGQLLFHFFRLYGHEVDYEKVVISVRQGSRMTREEKNWHTDGGQREGGNRLCVEEPFSTDRNLGNSADDYAWRGIHLEIRRAFDLLEDGQQLEKACEQYEFPAQEQSSFIFKKPTSQKATITSSVPTRNGRGGSNHRGGRGGFSSRNPNSGRRSSGSNSYIQPRPPFLHSPPIPASPGPEYFTFPRSMNDPMQLHDQLAQQYQMLEMQSNSLRAQLAAQQQAQQAHQVRAAQMHAHAVAQAQAQNRGQNGVSGSPQKSPYINGNASPRLGELGIAPSSLPQGFLYHYPGFFNPSQDAASQDVPRTNPSSPSLANSNPNLRRQIHRPSNASDTASLRSHSQPPRGGIPQPIHVGYPIQFFDPATATFAGYPIARSTPQDSQPQQPAPKAQRSPPTNPTEPKKAVAVQKPPEIATPKDYVGYYVADPPAPAPAPRQLQDYAVGPIPSFSELAHRRRRVSPEIMQPLLNTALRRVSRSPSPLGGHVRGYSTSGQDPNAQFDEQRKTRLDSVRPQQDMGPIIVNGSFPTPPREPRDRRDTVESLPPDLAKNPGLGIYTANQHAVYQINEIQARQQMVYEEMQRQKTAVAESMSPTIVNGSTKRDSSAESNGLSRVPSEGQQPFPMLPDGWMNYDMSNGHGGNHVEEVSPKRTLPPQWRTPAYTNGLPQLDTSHAPRAHPPEIKSATLPLLSPVFETHTPSPTASRSNDAAKTANGTKGQAKDSNQQNRRPSQTPPTNPLRDNRNGQTKSKAQQNTNDGSKSAGATNNSPWQQPTNRKGKNGNRKKKAAEQKTTGEPLPANAAERKGG